MDSERTILAKLKLDTALHIGSSKGGEPTDLPLRRTGDGRLFIPGRAIGGSLRSVATRLAPRLGLEPCQALLEATNRKPVPCRCQVCQLFGELYPDENDDEQGGAASQLWVSDAFPKDNDLQTSVRDGVGIGRSTGAAARHAKFDYEVVPRNTVFTLRLRLIDDNSEAANQRAQLLVAALTEWQAGRGQLGGNISRGLGRFHLQSLRSIKTNLNSIDDLIAYLQADHPWEVESLNLNDKEWWTKALTAAQMAVQSSSHIEPETPATGGFISVAFTLVIDGPFLTNDPLIAMLSGFDHAPLVEIALTQSGQAGIPLLSGASLRGLLRTRAEKIARTLATLRWPTRTEFLAHCPACDPLVGADYLPLASCDRRLDIPNDEEVPEDDLCLACQLFGSTRRGSRLWVEDGHWAGPNLEANLWKAQDFVAIDRFTGGGQEHAKFDAAPLLGPRFKTRLTLNTPRPWELGWLALLLRDLADGELTIGFGSAKGYGQACATDFHWTIGYLTPDDFPGAPNLLVNPRQSGVYQLVTAEGEKDNWLPSGWFEQAQNWVKAFNTAATEFQFGNAWLPFKDDTFFVENGHLEKLYGLPRVEIEK